MSDNDIILRLRELAKPGTSLADVGGTCVFTEAANEIAHLREAIRSLADQDATLSVCNGAVTVEMDATPEMLEQFSQRGGPLMPFDMPQPTLTDAEREAIRLGEIACPGLRITDDGKWVDVWDVLRGLAARTGGNHG